MSKTNFKKVLMFIGLSVFVFAGFLSVPNQAESAVSDGFCNAGDATITVPATGAAVSGTVTVNWTFNGDDCNVTDPHVLDIEVSHDGGGSWAKVATSSLPTSITVNFDSTAGNTPDDTDYQFRLNSGGAIVNITAYSDVVIDNTAPVLASAVTADDDGNGVLDRIRVALTEATAGMAATCTTLGWTVTADDTTVLTVADCAIIDTTHLDLTITEDATHAKTDNTPSVAYSSVTGNTTDRAGNEITTGTVADSTDAAKPVITVAQWLDQDADGEIDRVTLTFSEQVDVADGNAGDGLDSIIIDDGAAVTIDDADYAASDTTTLTLDFTLDPITGTGIAGLTVAYDDAGTNAITDNAAAPNEVADGDVAESYTDGALPVFLSSTTADTNGDGTVDQAVIVYSEVVSIVDGNAGDGFPGVTFADTCVAVNDDYFSAGTTTSVVVLTGCTADDTSITADPTYTAAAGGIIDVSAETNEMDNLETVTGTDGAAPAIISSTGLDSDNDGKTNSYTITFSEALTNKGVAVLNTNFSAINATTTGAITVDTVGIGATAGGGATKVTLNLDDDDTDNYTGIIQFSYNGSGGGDIIEDASAQTNDYGDQTDVALTDDVKPVLLSSRGGDNGGTADVLNSDNEVIDFRFSEPMNAVLPSIAELEGGLTFAGGAADGNNLGDGATANTVTRVTLSMANDTYRVTRDVGAAGSNSTNLITPATDTVQVTLGTNIKDAAGNAANTVPAAVTVDSADIDPPGVNTRETQDLDVNGQIDAIKFTMDENIDDSTIAIGDFATGHANDFDATFTGAFGGLNWVNGVSTAGGVDDDTFYLKLVESGTPDTDAIPTTTYTQGTLADTSTNLLASDGAPVASTDAAAPAAVAAVYKDDGDGQVDSVEITFSEAVILTLYVDGEWTIAEAGTIVLTDETNAVAALSVITLDALGAVDTTGGATDPQITYTKGGGNNVNDGLGNNTATFTITATDDAAPIVASQKYIDANGDGQVDGVELTLTENQTTCTAEVGDFAYTAGDITSSDLTGGSVACLTNKVTLTLGTAGDFGITSHGAGIPTIDYTDDVAREISDVGGHQLATFGAAVNLADGAGPVVTVISITDVTGDGVIDQANLTYSENLQNTVGGANGFDVTSVADHGACAGETADPAVSTALALDFTCTNVYTAVGDLNVEFTANAGVLDAAGNQAPTVTLTVASVPVAIDDAAKPVMASAVSQDIDHDGTVDALLISFSEPVDITDPGADDYITLAASSGVATIVVDDYSDIGALTLLLAVEGTDADDTSITIDPTYVTPATGTIIDASLNEMANGNTVVGIDGAEPVILTATFNDTDANGNIDSVDLVFSEQVAITDAGGGADGLDSIIIDDGAVLAIDDGAYASGGTTTLTLPFADHTGTAITGITVTYSTAGANVIADTAAANEITDAEEALAYVDTAAPVPMTASSNKLLTVTNNLRDATVITVTFSEDVVLGAVANGNWKFARNFSEALAAANWPDGSTIAYGVGATAKELTMTLTGVTTSNLWSNWLNGTKLNLNADNTATITDGDLNQADMNAVDLVITGLSNPTDVTPPTVEQFYPADGAIGVSVNTGIAVLFNEVMDATTFIPANVKLYKTSDLITPIGLDEIIGNSYFTLDGVPKTELIVYPTLSLEYEEEYTLVVTNDVTDASGNAFAGLAANDFTFTTAAESVGVLSVDGIYMNEAKRYATADDTYGNGWEWYIDLTVPTDEPTVKLKFSNFVGTAPGGIAAANNIRYFSEESTDVNAEGSAVTVTAEGNYPATVMTFDATSDLNAALDGWQVRVRVQVKIPAATAGGSYSAQFGVLSN